MKFKYLAIGTIAASMLYSCGGGTTETAATAEVEKEATTIESATYSVDAAGSEVVWKGEVAGVYGHFGTIAISNGSLDISNNEITGGKFTIDMTTITPKDEGYKDEDGSRASDLVGHLSTGDFFLVDSFPTSTFVIKSYEAGKLKGDLTVRGITKEETIEVSSLEVTENGINAKGKLVFNRQDYDVKWVHYMKDMILSDDISAEISLSAKI